MSSMSMPLPVTNLQSGDKREESFLKDLIDNLGSELPTPEVIVVNQDDDPTGDDQCMFFISKGQCKVSVRSEA